MRDDLVQTIAASDSTKATERFKEQIKDGKDPWDIHLSLFPVVQQVLNPPFINPHLPKMYTIYREFLPYVEKADLPGLVGLEVNEYAKRPKLEMIPKPKSDPKPVPFSDIEAAISYRDFEMTAGALLSYYEQEGGGELARRMLLLGSAYLDNSLGHSISCTAFILLEMLQRADQDPWPAIVCLADYFCKGGFQTPPTTETSARLLSENDYHQELLRASTGGGITNLHHTITLFSIERLRHLVTKDEYQHMLHAWLTFMGPKDIEPITLDLKKGSTIDSYDHFFKSFSQLKVEPVVVDSIRMVVTQDGRKLLGRYLIKALCDLYKGDYNPHYLTGLGSTLWIIDRYWKERTIVATTLSQYLDFFFTGFS